MTKFWGHKKQDFVKYLRISNLQSLIVPRMRLELTRTLLPKGFSYHYGFRHHSVCGLDYSFTIGMRPLGVPCLVSAPSSFQRLGSRLPSVLPVKVSLNLRHSTSLFSESALKLCLSPSCLPFHHQGKWIGTAKIGIFFGFVSVGRSIILP